MSPFEFVDLPDDMPTPFDSPGSTSWVRADQANSEETLSSLKAYVRDGARVCPQPEKWNVLWEMLPERRRVGSGWDPPLPLILAAWWHTSAAEKMARLGVHIDYAAEHGLLEEVDRFLRSLPELEWAHLNDF